MTTALTSKFDGATNNAFNKSLSLVSVIETMQERYSNDEIMFELAAKDQYTQNVLQAKRPTEDEVKMIPFSEWFQDEFDSAFKHLIGE